MSDSTAATQMATSSSSYSLSNAVKSALVNNPRIKSASYSVKAAKHAKWQGTANLLPDVTLNANAELDHKHSGIGKDNSNPHDVNLAFSQPIVDFKAFAIRLRAAPVLLAAEYDFEVVKQKVMLGLADLMLNIYQSAT